MSSEKGLFYHDDSQLQDGRFDDYLRSPEDFMTQSVLRTGQYMESFGQVTPPYDCIPEFWDIPIQGDEAANADQTSQIQPKQTALPTIHNNVRPSRNVNSMTRKGDIFANGTECNSKEKSTLDVVALTKERKKLNDQNYRKRKREEKINLQEENKNFKEANENLKKENKNLREAQKRCTCRNHQPKSSLEKRKAMFELNFGDRESMKKATNKVLDLPVYNTDLDSVLLKMKKGRVKLEGIFDADTVLHELNKVCPTHLLSSKSYAIAGSSMPGPSTAANSRGPQMQYR